jgi:hypothetical protein
VQYDHRHFSRLIRRRVREGDFICIGTAPLDTHLARLPAEAIDIAVADDGASTLADDNSPRFLDQDAVDLAQLAAGAAPVVEVASTGRCVPKIRRKFDSGEKKY